MGNLLPSVHEWTFAFTARCWRREVTSCTNFILAEASGSKWSKVESSSSTRLWTLGTAHRSRMNWPSRSEPRKTPRSCSSISPKQLADPRDQIDPDQWNRGTRWEVLTSIQEISVVGDPFRLQAGSQDPHQNPR